MTGELKPKERDAMVFDMDGVLADTEPFHVEAERITCVEHGFDIDPADWAGFKGQSALNIFQYLIDHYGDSKHHSVEDLVAFKTRTFMDLATGQIKPIEGAIEFLEWAKTYYAKIGLATSSTQVTQLFICKALGIDGHFDAIVTSNDVERFKPHPEPYHKALTLLGSIGIRALVIEDSKAGIASGLAAGADVLAITTSHSAEELLKANPTMIARNFRHAQQLATNYPDFSELKRKSVDPDSTAELERIKSLFMREISPDGFIIIEEDDPDVDIFDAINSLPPSDPKLFETIRAQVAHLDIVTKI